MRRLLQFAAVIGLVFTAPACAGKQASSRTGADRKADSQAQALFSKGNDQLEAGRWDRAIKLYRRATNKNSERWDIWLNLGIAHSQAGHYDRALDAIERSLETGGSERSEVYYNLGNIYQRNGRYGLALEAYRDAIDRADSPSADTYVNIGATLLALNRRDEALEAYRKARDLAPNDVRARHGLAMAFFRNDRPSRALEVLESLESDAPDMPRLHFDRARVFAELGKDDRAAESLETYLERAPEGPFAKRARSMLERLRSDGPATESSDD